MKKFEQLGRSLSKEDQKLIKGGNDAVLAIDDGGEACPLECKDCPTPSCKCTNAGTSYSFCEKA